MLVFWLYYERIMFTEEEFLRKKFGENYMLWANTTPAFVPSFRNFVTTNVPFSLKNVLKREYNGFFAVLLVLFLFEMIGDWVADRRLTIDTYWIVLMSIGFVIWFSLIMLKRNTTLLNVDGR